MNGIWRPLMRMFRAYLRMSKHDGERPLDEPANDQQNGYLRSSISLERGRSGIAGWRLSRRYGRGTNGGTVLSSLPARVDHDFSADRISSSSRDAHGRSSRSSGWTG